MRDNDDGDTDVINNRGDSDLDESQDSRIDGLSGQNQLPDCVVKGSDSGDSQPAARTSHPVRGSDDLTRPLLSGSVQPPADVEVIKIIKVLVKKGKKWYYCNFSDGKNMYIEYENRSCIPQSMRDAFHAKYTWNNKLKKKKSKSINS